MVNVMRNAMPRYQSKFLKISTVRIHFYEALAMGSQPDNRLHRKGALAQTLNTSLSCDSIINAQF